MLGCGGLLPEGELALIWEHPVRLDERGERGLGAVVAADGSAWSSSGQTCTEQTCEAPEPLAIWWDEGQLLVGTSAGLYRDGALIVAEPEALAWAGQGSQWVCAVPGQILDHLGGSVPYSGRVVDLDLEDGRWLALLCDEQCLVLDAQGELARAGERGRVDLFEGRACWSDPQDQERGLIECEDGLSVQGLEGERLGAALDEGWAAGQLSVQVVPNRLRLVPLDGGTVLSLDRYRPGMPPSLAVGPAELVLGLPWGWDEGRVLVADRP